MERDDLHKICTERIRENDTLRQDKKQAEVRLHALEVHPPRDSSCALNAACVLAM